MPEDVFSVGRTSPAAAQWPVADAALVRKTVMVCGHKMSYVTGGTGPAMVLLHGLGANSFTWRYVLPTLAEHYTVYAPDMLGCGESDKADVDYGLQAMANYVDGFMHAVGLEHAIFVGHSLGGGLTMQYCHDYPGHADRIILVSTGGIGRDVHWLLRISTLPGADGVIRTMVAPRSPLPRMSRQMEHRRMTRLAQEFDPTTPTMLDRFQSEETLRAFLSMLRNVSDFNGQRLSALPHLSELTVPVLIIWGDRDSTIPLSHGHIAEQLIPCARLIVFDHCYHRPQIEAPQKFTETVLGFLQSDTWPPLPVVPAAALSEQRRPWQVSAATWRKLAPLAPVALAALSVPTGLLVRSRARRRLHVSV
jgi:pimeloyl-ACP methyl ester carboxylesterase